jgi:D-alanyl-D-alanine carboxypeptidase (penicillin-binding protein 5/6)
MIIDPEESQIGLSPGQELPRDLLIRAMLIVSANDAARALAVDIAGSEQAFAEQMNAMAAALGLANTHAVNATGLDAEGQYSSANDLINLAAFLMGNPTFQLTARRTDATLNERTFPSTNDLLTKYPGADGIKTGHTTAAGWCIVASATRDGRRIIAAVLGAPTEEARDAAATALLDWGFTQ